MTLTLFSIVDLKVIIDPLCRNSDAKKAKPLATKRELSVKDL
jgi:hypothetical protein